MDFARKQLEKYGWSDGKGLGKNENGIAEPLKPKRKHSNTGVGYDPATDFTDHWWSTLYDKAANNVEVKNKNGKTKKINRKNDGEFEITNSTWKLNKKKEKNSEEEYSEFFVKTVVMGCGGAKTTRLKASESESESENDSRNAIKITDEELFEACGGRTAHKGARHGLRALGKLARIELQEQILLKETKYQDYSHYKKLKKSSNEDSQLVEDLNLHSDEGINVLRKKKKSQVSDVKNITDSEKIPASDSKFTQKKSSVALNVNEDLNSRKSKKTKTHVKELNTNVAITEGEKFVKKNKKRKNNEIDDNISH